MNLKSRFGEQEQASEDQNQIPTGNLLIQDGEERRCQADYPGQRKKEEDPDEHREAKSDKARTPLLFRPQLSGENRNKDDVINAKNDLKTQERKECDPCLRIRQP